MPALNASQRALTTACNSTPVFPQPGDRPDATLVRDDDTGRVWVTTTTVHCTAPRHDTISAYKNLGCRCPHATHATVNYERRRAAGHVAPNQPAHMTMRRLQALAVIGWPSDDIAALIGRNPVSVSQTRRGAHDTVTGRTAADVLRVYRQLHDQTGPSDRTRGYARRQGWDGPSPILLFLDVDEVAVRRACDGDATAADLHRGERLAAVLDLRRAGLGYQQIAERLHVAQRQVHRDLTDLGLIARELEETG